MGVEPTQDGSTAPQTVLKTAPVTRPEAAPSPLTAPLTLTVWQAAERCKAAEGDRPSHFLTIRPVV
jgi:hypothetical protein